MNGSHTSPSDEQRYAIEHTEGPCMVLAGPGSGKTYVLTHRIAHLLTKPSIHPWNILALTFTNKAAREMTSRIAQLIGDPAKHLWIGTFHSLFARMLRIEAETIGLSRDFTIYDSEDSKKLIKKIIKELSLSEEKYKPYVVLNRVSNAKNRLLLDAKAYAAHAACLAEDRSVGKPHMTQLFTHYETRCQRAGALDFDDILLRTYQMLRDYPEIAAKYQERFQYVLVDEFQDTNALQYLLVKKLAKEHGNLCVIGDDAQSIYAFRGADLTHMLNFKKDFPSMEKIKLARNFRSTKHIVKAANALIRHNKKQLDKTLFTDNPLGDPIQLVQHKNDLEEGVYVGRSIFETSQRTQSTYDRFAVLYRTNRQSRLIEESLRKMGIPYRVRGGTSFYARKEIKDVLAYLRLLVNPNDEQAIERVINTPKRGIGSVTLEKVHAWALDQSIPLWEGLERSYEVLNPRIANAIKAFTNLINNYRAKVATEDAYAVARGITESSGLLKALYDEKSIEELGRHENVEELLSGIQDFVRQQEARGEEAPLSSYLQEISLMTGDEKDDDKPSVTLMTIHAAKGLEYDYVYLVGLEEGILPSSLMSDTAQGIEEERRLFYVALTRAKLRVILTYTVIRKQFENYKRVTPSRFIREIDPSLIDHVQHLKERKQSYGSPASQSSRTSSSPSPTPFPSATLVPLQKKLSSLSTPSLQLPPNLSVGTRVKHPQFGLGTVLSLSQTAHGARVKVAFEGVGTKTLLAAFAKLTVA